MRARLCYLALVLIPLVAYWPTMVTEYGTPEDFIRLQLGVDTPFAAQHGILHGALVEISFLLVSSVAQLVVIRALALVLVILTGIALWQMLERGGWSELDAAAIAAGVVLLPAAQLLVGWGAAWPAALAALLSLAGFAAAESELEQGGAKRFIAMFGGVLLYFAAAMCNLATATFALVPLAALGLVRPMRQVEETKRWFVRHAALLTAGIAVAWALERWMLADAGVDDRTTFLHRIADLFLYALPEGGALFFAATAPWQRGLAAAITLGVVFGVVQLVRRQAAADARVRGRWLLLFPGAIGLFALVVLLLPHWRGSYLNFWSLSGLALVALMGAWRGTGEQTARRKWWYFAAPAGGLVLGLFIAGGQTHQHLAVPLGREWGELRTQVLRANFAGELTVGLKVAADASRSDGVPEAGFTARMSQHASAAEYFFQTALRERFSSGLPKGVKVAATTAPEKVAQAKLVFDLTTHDR